MSSHVMHLHLEGMDLAGKSSTCRLLGRSGGEDWLVRHNSLVEANPIFALADRLRREDAFGAETLGHLFLAALRADLEQFAPPTRHAIQDSSILLRSLAYHSVAGTPRLPDLFAEHLASHPRFTRSFVLTASHRARVQRLEWRRRLQPDELAPDDEAVLRNPQKFFAMEARLIDLAVRYFDAQVIDTSELSPEQVVERILASVGRLPPLAAAPKTAGPSASDARQATARDGSRTARA